MPEPTMDFPGLTAAAANAFKPDYADVQARARRRRRRFTFGAGFLGMALILGGGSAIALSTARPDILVIPQPTAAPSPSATPVSSAAPMPDETAGPWGTTAPRPGARAPQPQPSFVRVGPDAWDVTEPDVPLTGIFPEMRAGDLDHLYLEYKQCEAADCPRMLAATADRGATWQKRPMPGPEVALALAHGSLLVAAEPGSRPAYWVSADAGGTWRQAEARTVEALPAGWPAFPEERTMAAVDPATGDLARIELAGSGPGRQFALQTPVGSGLWTLDAESKEMVARVSRDGGRTWTAHRLPDAFQDRDAAMNGSTLFTANGRTVYLEEELDNGVRLHVSTDGGSTWQARPELTLDGPMLSLLPVGDRILNVDGPDGTYRSTDQGRTFTKVGPGLGGRGRAIPGGYIIPTNNAEYSAWVSRDGATWTYVPRPEVP